jgi:hypothetical protein
VGIAAGFKIDVDGVERAVVRPGGSVTVEVESGLHEVAVRLRSHRTSITVDAAESEVRLIADVDDGEFNEYVAGGIVKKFRMYKSVMKRARSRPGYLRIRQASD